MENQNTKEYKYDAFISYRHAELDQFVAENLHKLLETFKVPRLAADSVKKQKKNKISRVFRDRDELPLASNLSDNIQSALEDSEFLIVICSPRTPESLWVQKEISTFISMHGRDKVLAVLIEGEPDQAFPRELCFEKLEKELEDGTKCVVEQSVEPLAADVRGSSKKEVLKNLKKEMLRIAAPLLGCSYDDLKQRHRERKIKRMFAASLAAAAVFFVFGSISMAMALRIQKQSVVIKEQSEELEEQYNEVLKRQAYTMADTSAELLEEGNRVAAVLVAKEALTEMPYTEQAQYALTEAVRVYTDGLKSMPTHLLQMSTNVEDFYISPEEGRILTVDTTGKLSVWDLIKGTEICSIVADTDYSILDSKAFGFADENHIVFQKGNEMVLYNIDEQQEKMCLPVTSHYVSATHTGTKTLAVGDAEKISLIDLETYTVKAEYSHPQEDVWKRMDGIIFDESGVLLAYCVSYDISFDKVLVLDTQKSECITEMDFAEKEIADFMFTDKEHLVLAVQEDSEESDNKKSYVELREIPTGDMKWSQDFPNEWVKEIVLHKNEEDLICQSYYDVTVLDISTGEEQIKVSFDNEIKKCIPVGDQNIKVIRRDGKFIHVFGDDGSWYDNSRNFLANSSNIFDFQSGKNFYATLPYNSNAVTIYQYTIGIGVEDVAEFENIIESVLYDRTGESYLVALYGDFEHGTTFLMDAKTNEKLAGFELGTTIDGMFFAGENEEQIGLFTSDALYFYDREGNYLRQLDFDAYGEGIVSVSQDGSKVVLCLDGVLKCFEIATLKEINEFSIEGENVAFVMGEKQQYVAAVFKEKGELQVFDFTTGEKKNSVPINSTFVAGIFMNETEQNIFVTYLDGTVEIYDRQSLSLQHTYTEFQNVILSMESIEEKNLFVLYGYEEAYLCKADNFEIVARVPGFITAAPDGESMFIGKNMVLAKVPIYGIEDLLEETERQLDDRQLSDEERERYHLGQSAEKEEVTEETVEEP